MENFKHTNWGRLFVPVLLLLLLFVVTDVHARAGGGGGGGSSRSYGGGSGGGDSRALGIALRVFFALPAPVKVVVIIIVLVFAFYAYNNRDLLGNSESIYKSMGGAFEPPKSNNLEVIIKNNPGFIEHEFLKQVEKAFHEIQIAWNKKDLSEVRKFISDGVWQRFNTQFLMMDKLLQTNRLESIFISDSYIDMCEQDGQFDIIHVAIRASLLDYFECELDSSLNSGGQEDFVEYWSFIKKRGVEQKDIYNSTACPSCGAPIEEGLGEVAACPYCGSILNSGEYDWILSEITQAEDYAKAKKVNATKNLQVKREQLVQENSDFSVQQIEDHTSNGYLQILAAKALHDPSRIKRFLSDEMYKQLEIQIKMSTYLYNRLYLNDVTLVAAENIDGYNRLYVSVTSTRQRVEKEQGGLYLVDPFLASESEVVRLIRKRGVQKAKGSLYMHQCPSCGGSIRDSLDTACPYCGSALNSSEQEWIFDAILTYSEYYEYIKENSKRFDFALKQKNLDGLLSVREYAIHNVMAIIAADGKITEEEEQFLNEFASKLKFKKEEKEAIVALARQNRLQLSLPEDQSAREKIYALMVEAAEADGEIQPQEKMILDYVEKQIYQ